MTQLLVEFNRTHVLYFDDLPSIWQVKVKLTEEEGIPGEIIAITIDGIAQEDSYIVVSEDCVMRASLLAAVCGGKGGFGAQLRALAKQKAHRKTVDFGACRDLNGRRLRHVNDEILLQKWKEAKDNNKSFESDEQTPTGIDLWYLSAPSWAEGIKVDKRKLFMKPRMKTEMCIDWKRARERRPAPEGAPAHWGCPRGRRCEFAHGVDELRGDAQTALKDAELQKKRDEQNQKRDAYMDVLHRSNKQEEDLADLVMTGLRAAKRAKLGSPAAAVEKSQSLSVGEVSEASADLNAAEGVGDSEDADVDVEQVDFLTVASGTVVVSKAISSTSLNGSSSGSRDIKGFRNASTVCPVISGTSAFATVVVDKCTLSADTESTWYYEVELQSDGLMQVGWVSSAFLSDTSISHHGEMSKAGKGDQAEAAADGVGDDNNSWGFDGYRQLKWHAGVSSSYGPQTGVIWKAGDIIGCCLELTTTTADDASGTKTKTKTPTNSKKRKNASEIASNSTEEVLYRAIVSYSVNGVSHGTAFEFDVLPTISGSPEQFFPAVSLENEEAVLLNVGNKEFKHRPSPKFTAVWSSVLGLENSIGENISNKSNAVEGAQTVDSTATVATNLAPAAVVVAVVTPTPAPAPVVDYSPINLEDEEYSEVAALEALGLVHLKQELERRGLKVGGTLQERAQRLLSVRGVSPDRIDPKLLAKKK